MRTRDATYISSIDNEKSEKAKHLHNIYLCCPNILILDLIMVLN
jgi:hypothetical protein